MVRTKVFVGNLSFKTREPELSQHFESVAKVVGVNIITRGPRSLGYGFVELETEEDAKKAVAAMDKKEIDGRPINVDIAKARPEGQGETKPAGTEGAEGSPRTTQPRAPSNRRGGATRGRGGAKAANATPASPSTAPASGDANASPAPEGAKRPRTRKPRAPKKEGEGATEGQTPEAKPKRERAPRPPKAESAPKAERPPRDPQNDTRIPSETSLFVANLPFSLTNESFGKILTDAGLKYKKAHVVVKRNQKSKGFGFVEFDNQEEQKKALDALTGKKIEDRELAPKVALVSDPKAPAETKPQSPAVAASPAAAASPAVETKTA